MILVFCIKKNRLCNLGIGWIMQDSDINFTQRLRVRGYASFDFCLVLSLGYTIKRFALFVVSYFYLNFKKL